MFTYGQLPILNGALTYGGDTDRAIANMARATAGTRTASGSRQLVRDFGTCLNFDGDGDYVNIPAGTLTAWDGESTLTFWMLLKSFSPSGDKAIVDSQWGNDNAGGWQIVINTTGGVTVYVGDQTGRDSNATQTGFLKNQWCFMSVSKKTSINTQNVYRNGALLNSRTNCTKGTTNTATGIVLRFAGNRTGGQETNVMLKDMRIHTSFLSIAEIQNIYYTGSIHSSTIHRWNFNEGSGSSAIDSIGSANGTIVNATYSTNVPIIPRTAV